VRSAAAAPSSPSLGRWRRPGRQRAEHVLRLHRRGDRLERAEDLAARLGHDARDRPTGTRRDSPRRSRAPPRRPGQHGGAERHGRALGQDAPVKKPVRLPTVPASPCETRTFARTPGAGRTSRSPPCAAGRRAPRAA
jgi:hypothetical protein